MKEKEQMRFLPLRYDKVFKGFFARESNKRFLLDLLNYYLDLGIKSEKDIHILNSELTPNSFDDKMPRLDLRIKINNEKWINIEVQTDNKYDLKKRVLYYNSKVYSDQLEQGKNYGDLEQVYSLVFVYYNEFTTSNNYIHTVADYILEDNELLENGRRVKFIEIGKYIKHKDIFAKDEWAELLAATEDEEFDEIIERGGLMAEAAKEINGFTQRDIDNYWRDMAQKADWERHSLSEHIRKELTAEKDKEINKLRNEKNREIAQLETEKNKAITKLKTEKNKEIAEKSAKAKVVGIDEGRLMVAKNMFINNFNIDDIAKCTNLSIEQLLKFKEENNL